MSLCGLYLSLSLLHTLQTDTRCLLVSTFLGCRGIVAPWQNTLEMSKQNAAYIRPTNYLIYTLQTVVGRKKFWLFQGVGGMVPPWRNTLSKSKQTAAYGRPYTTNVTAKCFLLNHRITVRVKKFCRETRWLRLLLRPRPTENNKVGCKNTGCLVMFWISVAEDGARSWGKGC